MHQQRARSKTLISEQERMLTMNTSELDVVFAQETLFTTIQDVSQWRKT